MTDRSDQHISGRQIVTISSEPSDSVPPMPVDPNRPLDYPTVCAYLTVSPASDAVEWYRDVLGAEVRMLLEIPGGAVAHAELQIGDSVVMLADPFDDGDQVPPSGTTGVHLSVMVDDCDAAYRIALDAGAAGVREPKDQFYGDRTAMFVDPFGHSWNVQHTVERLSPNQIMERMSGGASD